MSTEAVWADWGWEVVAEEVDAPLVGGSRTVTGSTLVGGTLSLSLGTAEPNVSTFVSGHPDRQSRHILRNVAYQDIFVQDESGQEQTGIPARIWRLPKPVNILRYM